MPTKRFSPIDLNLPDTPVSAEQYDDFLAIYQAFRLLIKEVEDRGGRFILQSAETIPANSFVFLDNLSRIFLADNTADDFRTCAFCRTAIPAGKFGVVDFDNNYQDGFTGLVPGRTYYLGPSLGSAVLTPPSATGTIVQEVGIALSSTELYVRIGSPVVNP